MFIGVITIIGISLWGNKIYATGRGAKTMENISLKVCFFLDIKPGN
jgi:hypothetical protein